MPNYNDTPLAADRINDTQSLIRENFNSIDTAWQINHVDITDGIDYGKHSGADFVELTNHPTVAATDVTLYNFVNPTTTNNELYVKKTGALGVAGTPFTAYEWDAINNRGWTYLPSGLLMKWGLSTANGVTNFTNADAPYYTTIYNVGVTPLAVPADSNRDVILLNVTVNAGVSFVLQLDGARRLANTAQACDFYWTTIGV